MAKVKDLSLHNSKISLHNGKISLHVHSHPVLINNSPPVLIDRFIAAEEQSHVSFCDSSKTTQHLQQKFLVLLFDVFGRADQARVTLTLNRSELLNVSKIQVKL